MLTCLAEETRTCMDQSCKAMKEQQQTISHLVMCGNFPPEHDLLTFRVGFANLQSSASPNIERCRKIRSKLSDLHRREGSLFPDRPIIWTPFEFIINMNCHTLSTPVAALIPMWITQVSPLCTPTSFFNEACGVWGDEQFLIAVPTLQCTLMDNKTFNTAVSKSPAVRSCSVLSLVSVETCQCGNSNRVAWGVWVLGDNNINRKAWQKPITRVGSGTFNWELWIPWPWLLVFLGKVTHFPLLKVQKFLVSD